MDCLDLELPKEAFTSLELPAIDKPFAVGEQAHVLWLCRAMWIALHATQREITPHELVEQLRTQDQVDQLCIDYAQSFLSAQDAGAWPQIVALVDSLSEPALPVRFKHRDRRIPALKLYIATAAQRSALKTDAVFAGLTTLTDYDPDHYRALTAVLDQDGLPIAKAALSLWEGDS
jgi:hypothetical protein